MTTISTVEHQVVYRLINSKFPPISMFDDVASVEDFDTIFALQSLTNPRLLDQLGHIDLVNKADIPFGINGCSYATAPFTHVNKDGSRFSNGSFGVLYLANDIDTAIAETKYHQQKMLMAIKGVHYDTIIMRGLRCVFTATLTDSTVTSLEAMSKSPIYHQTNYSEAQQFGAQQRKSAIEGIHYTSVRNPLTACYALFTPRCVEEIVQSSHYEYVWGGSSIDAVRLISAP
jgi:RES domain-containing protein